MNIKQGITVLLRNTTHAVDVYGHGESSDDESLYYIDVNGDDLITFINEVIGEPTVVAGHSNGALTTAYIAAYGGNNIAGAVLEDPSVFSTEGEGWEQSFFCFELLKLCGEIHSFNKPERNYMTDIAVLNLVIFTVLFLNYHVGVNSACSRKALRLNYFKIVRD